MLSWLRSNITRSRSSDKACSMAGDRCSECPILTVAFLRFQQEVRFSCLAAGPAGPALHSDTDIVFIHLHSPLWCALGCSSVQPAASPTFPGSSFLALHGQRFTRPAFLGTTGAALMDTHRPTAARSQDELVRQACLPTTLHVTATAPSPWGRDRLLWPRPEHCVIAARHGPRGLRFQRSPPHLAPHPVVLGLLFGPTLRHPSSPRLLLFLGSDSPGLRSSGRQMPRSRNSSPRTRWAGE